MSQNLMSEKLYKYSIRTIVSVLGIAIFISSIPEFYDKSMWSVLFGYSLLTILATIVPIRTPSSTYLTLNNAVIISGILLYGINIGYWSAFIELLIFSFISRIHPIKIFVNAGQIITTVAIAGIAHQSLLAQSIPWTVSDVLLVLIYLSVNVVLCSIGMSAFSTTSAWSFMKTMLRDGAATYITIMLLGLIGARLVSSYGLQALIPIGICLCVLSYVSYQYFNSLKQLSYKVSEVEKLNEALLISMSSAIDARDPYTLGHSKRVAYWARQIGIAMHLPKNDIQQIYSAGIIHDIGKIGVEDSILNKPGKLTHEEFEKIKQHPVIGYQILEQSGAYQELLPAVRWHHERMDGKGYPDGLKGDEIPLIARILAVADSFDAMVSDRPYRKGMSVEQALKEIKESSGTQFDPTISDTFIQVINSLPEKEAAAAMENGWDEKKW